MSAEPLHPGSLNLLGGEFVTTLGQEAWRENALSICESSCERSAWKTNFGLNRV
jgi:hypothetical protein